MAVFGGGKRPTPRSTAGKVGELAQLGERLVCNQEVTGSSPVFSTTRVDPDSGMTATDDFRAASPGRGLRPPFFDN